MTRNSLRTRVTAFYVGMLALALMVFSIAVYAGVQAFLTKSLERTLNNTAHSLVADYLVPLDSKGNSWFQSEMSESYPPGVSDPFVRISQGGNILYQSGDLRDPFVSVLRLPLPTSPESFDTFRRVTAASGQPLMIYTMAYTSPKGQIIAVETGANMEPIGHLLHSLLTILLIVTPVILLAAAVGGYILMARPLRPVVTLTEHAERVGRKQLGERLPIIPTGDELERLSLALNRMIDRLEEALAHNQRFSADASHELRTPLTIIRGELEELLQMPTLPPEAVEGIGSALEESDRMAWIVHSLLTISRLDGGGERIQMQPVDLAGIIHVTLEHMSLLAEEKGIAITCDVTSPLYVTGDSMRLKQVVVNLVDNAIKYTPAGGKIVVCLKAREDRAVLQVSDTGIGIPEASLPLVFDRFYRTDQARSRESGGTGLGLSIVKSICGAHDGVLSVESREGVGTTLRMELQLLTLSPKRKDELQSAALAQKQELQPQPVADLEDAPAYASRNT
jgi:heavy metal sensor kinase